jgi:hypothetical protein
MAVQDRDDPASYCVLMRAKNDVDARRLTTIGNSGSKNQLPRRRRSGRHSRIVAGVRAPTRQATRNETAGERHQRSVRHLDRGMAEVITTRATAGSLTQLLAVETLLC